jgi:hypothetical protein
MMADWRDSFPRRVPAVTALEVGGSLVFPETHVLLEAVAAVHDPKDEEVNGGTDAKGGAAS